MKFVWHVAPMNIGARRKKGKKNPHIMWGKTGMVSMARKTGLLLVTTGTATKERQRRLALHLRNLTKLFHALLVFLVQNRLLLGR